MTVGLNIKNPAVVKLAEEISRMAGETKTEAIRKALEERKARLSLELGAGDRAARLRRFLEEEAWPMVPPTELGRGRSKADEEEILGFGQEGV